MRKNHVSHSHRVGRRRLRNSHVDGKKAKTPDFGQRTCCARKRGAFQLCRPSQRVYRRSKIFSGGGVTMFWHFAARVAAAALSLPALLFALRFFQQTGYNVARGYIRIALSRCFVCGAICVALLVPVEILLGDYSDAVLAGCSFASAAVALSVRAKVLLKFTRRATRLFVVSTVACTVGFLFLPSYLLPLLPFWSFCRAPCCFCPLKGR